MLWGIIKWILKFAFRLVTLPLVLALLTVETMVGALNGILSMVSGMLITFLITPFAVYYICVQQWSELWPLLFIIAGLVLILFCGGLITAVLDAAIGFLTGVKVFSMD